MQYISGYQPGVKGSQVGENEQYHFKKATQYCFNFFSIFSWIFAFYFLVEYQMVLLLHAHKSCSSETISLTYAKTRGFESCSCFIYKNGELPWHKIYNLILLSVFCNSSGYLCICEGVEVKIWRCAFSISASPFDVVFCCLCQDEDLGSFLSTLLKKGLPSGLCWNIFCPKTVNIWREIHTKKKKAWKLHPSGENFKFSPVNVNIFVSCTVGMVTLSWTPL